MVYGAGQQPTPPIQSPQIQQPAPTIDHKNEHLDITPQSQIQQEGTPPPVAEKHNVEEMTSAFKEGQAEESSTAEESPPFVKASPTKAEESPTFVQASPTKAEESPLFVKASPTRLEDGSKTKSVHISSEREALKEKTPLKLKLKNTGIKVKEQFKQMMTQIKKDFSQELRQIKQDFSKESLKKEFSKEGLKKDWQNSSLKRDYETFKSWKQQLSDKISERKEVKAEAKAFEKEHRIGQEQERLFKSGLGLINNVRGSADFKTADGLFRESGSGPKVVGIIQNIKKGKKVDLDKFDLIAKCHVLKKIMDELPFDQENLQELEQAQSFVGLKTKGEFAVDTEKARVLEHVSRGLKNLNPFERKYFAELILLMKAATSEENNSSGTKRVTRDSMAGFLAKMLKDPAVEVPEGMDITNAKEYAEVLKRHQENSLDKLASFLLSLPEEDINKLGES